MSLKVKQICLFSFCFLAALGLYSLGNTKTPLETSKPVEAATSKAVEESFATVETAAIAKLPVAQRDSINLLQQAFKNANTAEQKLVNLENLANKWLSYGNPDMNAYYTLQKLELDNGEQNLLESVKKAEIAAQMSPDSTAQVYFTEKSLAIYQQLEEQFPDSLQYSIQKAALLIDKKQEVMQGVLILRDIIQKDSLNLQANFMLGKLSVVSGQHDKAIGRLQTVLKIAPTNTEALYFLGEAYIGLGKKTEAIEAFEKCKELVDNPVFKKELDKYINSIIINQ